MRTNFQMADENITMVSGDTLSFNVVLKDQSGEAVTVSDASFIAQRNYGEAPIVWKRLGQGISQTGEVLTVRLSPEDTANYVGFLYYDFDITVNGDRFTLLRGMLQLEADCRE